MSDSRAQRVADFIREEGSEIISRDEGSSDSAHDYHNVGRSVWRSLSREDLRVGNGRPGSEEATMTALNKGKGFFGQSWGGELSLRHVPEVVFRLDESMESGARILDILSKLSAGEDLPDSGEPGS